MSIVIGTNVPALNAAHHMRTTRDGMETAMERLASGKRINSSSDDAAGVGIAARMTAQVRGLNMSIRNAQDGISAAQVAESALVEVENMAQRIRELAVQKANNTYNSTDITNISAEIIQLNAEIARIAADTKFNSLTVNSFAFTFAISGNDSTTSMSFPGFISSAGATASAADTAINSIATARGTLGSYINRLEFTVNNLSNISANTSAALSRIQDADFAAESAEVAKGRVLQQSGAAMLAQANASTQYVLSLLQ